MRSCAQLPPSGGPPSAGPSTPPPPRPLPAPPPCRSAGVAPDNQLYGMLMRAVGAGGDLDAVLGLQAEMAREGLRPCKVRCPWGRRGLGAAWAAHCRRWGVPGRHPPAVAGWPLDCTPLSRSAAWPACNCTQPLPPARPNPLLPQGTQSALMAVFIQNGQLAEAQGVYRRLRGGGEWPELYAMNALINASAREFRWAGRGRSMAQPGLNSPGRLSRHAALFQPAPQRPGGLHLQPAGLHLPACLPPNRQPPPAPLPPTRRLGDVVSLVCEMGEGGLRPDAFTFAAIFNACQRADEAELALDVARWVGRGGGGCMGAAGGRLPLCCRAALPAPWQAAARPSPGAAPPPCTSLAPPCPPVPSCAPHAGS